MSKRLTAIFALALLTSLVGGCKRSESDNGPAASGMNGAQSASAGTQTAKSFDLSTKEQALRTMHKALRDGDKDTFRRCVSKNVLERVGKEFDSWFEVWRREAEKRSVEEWVKYSSEANMINEDGNWRLNER